MRTILITGGAGFIGSHLIDFLLEKGEQVICVDNFDTYYDPSKKRINISPHIGKPNFVLIEEDICDRISLEKKLSDLTFEVIVHIAARAGVRPSITNPEIYERVNISGTLNMLEIARQRNIKKFIFASSSSVYGTNQKVPWSEDDNVLRPISPYAATKVAGELLGYTYSHLYGIQFIALRFFTVYGPRQRPDLAIHKFAKMLIEGKPIVLYGNGSTQRDYTYIDDIIQGLYASIEYNDSIYEVINLGNNSPISLTGLVDIIEKVFDTKIVRHYDNLPPGDVPQTYADISKAYALLNYTPQTTLEEGIRKFKDWFLASQPNQADEEV